MESPTQQARAIEEARVRLEQSLAECVNNYLASHPEPVEINVAFDDQGQEASQSGSPSNTDEALLTQIRSLVGLFHQHEAVKRSGVQVRHVTAIDSNGDGQAAVNVRYVYPDEG